MSAPDDDPVAAQYEAYPYPARDPADEARRLVTGSPSHPLEIDHFVFSGRRDWSQPFRALVAGGGTGDALIQMAAVLAAAGRPFEITYLDLSRAARKVAAARAAARGLEGIRFLTGSLLDAPDLGAFDYIDCCGVLHHLSDPQAGLDALARALAPGGGIGLMVYAPYGRSGVYPLQEAFAALGAGLAPAARLAMARKVLARVPEGHPFRLNPHLGDHEQGDAGFYDLLLHGRDRPFLIGEVLAMLGAAGLAFAGSPQAWLYDLAEVLPEGVAVPEGLAATARMELAEKLRGTIRTHIVYARAARAGARAGATGRAPATPGGPQAVAHLRGVAPAALARAVAAKGEIRLTQAGVARRIAVPRAAARLLAMIDGHTPLATIAARAGLDAVAFAALWSPAERALTAAGLLVFSRLLVRP